MKLAIQVPGPQPFERWKPRSGQLRTVYDRTLGGDVLYSLGDKRRGCHGRCTLEAWNAWIKDKGARRSPAR